MKKKNIAILGSTGSIGKTTLNIIKKNKKEINIFFLSTNKNINTIYKQAIENDVHVIGISSLAGGHKTLIKELFLNLNEYHSNEIMVVIGGIIPKADHQFLKNLGVSANFGPGSNINEIAIKLLNLLLQKK